MTGPFPGIIALAPEELAEQAGLQYGSDERAGLRRQRCGRGFIYRYPDGRRVRDRTHLARIRDLVIPPAWTDVWICCEADGHLQATGRDDRQRKQYIYHPRWQETASRMKFDTLAGFGLHLPKIRSCVASDLQRRKLSAEMVAALAIRLLDLTAMRVGSVEYALDNDTYGLTTLQKRHVAVSGERLEFRYRGKSGRRHCVVLKDRRLARRLQRVLELRGRPAFQYLEDGQVRALAADDVNRYLLERAGAPFTARFFRP